MIGHRLRSRCRRVAVLVVTAIVAALVLGSAAPASAHATLLSTDPAEGAVLASAPERILFTFNEPVSAVPDGVQVFDAGGESVGSSATARGPELRVELSGPVGEGTLVVAWRVVSADGHPVAGSLSFSIGAPSETVATPGETRSDPSGVPVALSLTRWIGYVALLLATGLAAFTLVLLPSGVNTDRAGRRLVVAARVAGAAAVASWLVGLPMTALYQQGLGVGAVTDTGTWSTLPAEEYLLVAAVVLGTSSAVLLLADGRPGLLRRVGCLGAGALAVGAPALTGHPRATEPQTLAVAADMLHLVAGSVWLGGLVGLALTLPALAGRGTAAADVLVRFSALAATVLAALVMAGAFLAWRIVGSWGALVETGYGRLLLVKIGVAVVAVVVASWNRYALLPRLRRATGYADRRVGARLVSRATAVEAVVLVAVLGVTGFLVNKSPAAEAEPAAARPASTGVETAVLGDLHLRATMSPSTTGSNTITVQVQDHTGEPVEGLEPPRVRVSTEEVDLGQVPVTAVSLGTYSARVVLPTAGNWKVQVSLRVSEFDNPVASVSFRVR